jgi:hypothetical protein
LKKVQGENSAGLNTSNVAECASQLLSVNSWVVDNERSTALTVTAATKLTLTGAKLAGCLNLLDIWGCTNSLQETESGGSSGNGSTGEDLGVNNERNFWDGGDLVTTGEEESWNGRSSKGRNGCESLLT